MAVLTVEDYAAQIKLMLGAPVLDIEISDQIPEIINIAFKKVNRYIDTPHYQTIPVQSTYSNECSAMDVSEYNIRAVLFVARAETTMVNATDSSNSLLWDPLSITLGQNYNYSYNYGAGSTQYSQTNMLKGYTSYMLYQQLRNTLQQDLDYTFDAVNQKLYLYQQVPAARTITIVYNKEYTSVEEITDPFWQNILYSLSLAYTKQVLGRVRSKFKMVSAPYELDGDTLLAEASAELEKIESFLDANNDVFIPMG